MFFCPIAAFSTFFITCKICKKQNDNVDHNKHAIERKPVVLINTLVLIAFFPTRQQRAQGMHWHKRT